MKPNIAIFALGALVLLSATSAFAAAPWLPQPAQVDLSDKRLELHDDLAIQIAPDASPRVHEIAALLRNELNSSAHLTAQIEATAAATPRGSIRLSLLSKSDPAANPESYTLRVGDNVEILATDPRGLLWGVQTLLQGLDSPSAASPSLARGEIVDQPAYAWRAVMLDTVRSFLDLDFIKRTVRVMSAYKLNILHLHLTDDHAWRFESKVFPGVNPPGEPFYTQAELKELVAYAERYGVEIVPEFDFPGHAHAAVTAYPALDCEGKPRPMDEAIFCAGKPFTWEFMNKVIAEAAAVFPSHYLHVGADEPFAVKRWTTCPDCQARMKAKGVTSTAALYHTFVADLNALVQRHGRQMIVWNDAIKPGVAPMPPKDILIDAWTGEKNVTALAEAGYTLINSSNRPLYISSYSKRFGFPLRLTWQWTPRIFGLRVANVNDPDLQTTPLPDSAKILGGQACAWATDQRIMERRLYPRLLAVAETLWSGEHRGDYADFSARLSAGQIERLHRLGVPDDDALPTEALFTGLDLAKWAVSPPTDFSRDGDLLRAPASANDVLRTRRNYRDFILTFDRRAERSTGKTGFHIRCSGTPAGGTPQGFAILSTPPPGMRIVAGDVAKLEGWNHFELVARGGIVSLTINGYLAWSVTDPAPQAGPIALTGDDGTFELRDVFVRPLDLEAEAQPSPLARE